MGSVFSPYYVWAGRRDPLDHCAVNVALYGPRGSLWAMTERKRRAVALGAADLAIGRSTARWSAGRLVVDIDEWAAPVPRRLRGRVILEAATVNPHAFTLEEAGGHWWRPLLPAARVAVEMDAPRQSWRGVGYFDQNAGDEPLEAGFSGWTWSRAATHDGTTILYDARRRRGPPLSLALRFGPDGVEPLPAPPEAALPRSAWRIARVTRADDGRAALVRSFEDTPFYARGLVSHRLFGEQVQSVHEALSLDRFANPIVRLMLPFRMPRL